MEAACRYEKNAAAICSFCTGYSQLTRRKTPLLKLTQQAIHSINLFEIVGIQTTWRSPGGSLFAIISGLANLNGGII